MKESVYYSAKIRRYNYEGDKGVVGDYTVSGAKNDHDAVKIAKEIAIKEREQSDWKKSELISVTKKIVTTAKTVIYP